MRHNNISLPELYVKDFKLKGGESPGMEVEDKIRVMHQLRRSIQNAYTNFPAGTLTVLTSDANKRTFLTGITLSYDCTNANTSTTVSLACTIKGITEYLVLLSKTASTARHDSISIEFIHPIEIDKYTNVTIALTDNANIQASSSVYYYEEED